MNHKITTYTTLAAGILSMLLTACAETDGLPGNPATASEGEIAITLHIPADTDITPTRALPTGGEDGDGREDGLRDENTVSDANIFFFKGGGFNPTDPVPEEIEVAGVYMSDLSAFTTSADEQPFEKKITIRIRLSESGLEEHGITTAPEVGFITVLNAGRDLSSDIKDMATLRAYSGFTSSWRKTEDGYSDFLMTTAYDAGSDGYMMVEGNNRFVGSNRLEKSGKYSEDSDRLWIGEATVQRLCARVDLMYKIENLGVNELVYPVEGGGTVHITNLLPVNFMSVPSYLLTKTTAGIPAEWSETSLGDITWGGIQKTAGTTDRPTNYVIEPSTLAKAARTGNLSTWFGETAASSIADNLKDASKGRWASYRSGEIPADVNRGYDRTTIIGYANENTQPPSCYTSDFITGIAIRALYRPGSICSKVEEDYKKVELTEVAWQAMSDKTFWRYQPTVAVEGVKESDALYFTSEAEAKAYQQLHPSDLATLTEYPGGVCYYNLWLRHYNDETYKTENSLPKETYPMEFAIVRNNIYRIAVSFSGPGDPTPTLREPDTMVSRIFVRKWNLRQEKNPLKF